MAADNVGMRFSEYISLGYIGHLKHADLQNIKYYYP